MGNFYSDTFNRTVNFDGVNPVVVRIPVETKYVEIEALSVADGANEINIPDLSVDYAKTYTLKTGASTVTGGTLASNKVFITPLAPVPAKIAVANNVATLTFTSNTSPARAGSFVYVDKSPLGQSYFTVNASTDASGNSTATLGTVGQTTIASTDVTVTVFANRFPMDRVYIEGLCDASGNIKASLPYDYLKSVMQTPGGLQAVAIKSTTAYTGFTPATFRGTLERTFRVLSVDTANSQLVMDNSDGYLVAGNVGFWLNDQTGFATPSLNYERGYGYNLVIAKDALPVGKAVVIARAESD